MTIESGTYISDLNSSNPAAGDNRSEGDDHLRLIKSFVKNTFPNVTGAVNPTHTELNYVDGVTSAIQTQLDAKAPTASPTLTGTAIVSALTATGLLTAQAGITVSGGAVNLTAASSVTATTQAVSDDSTKVATTEFVKDVAMNAALPSQSAAVASYVISTNGSVASWTPNAGQMLYLADHFT